MAGTLISRIVGPRVAPEDLAANSLRYGIPSVLLLVARVFVLVSLFLPYWKMELVAPPHRNRRVDPEAPPDAADLAVVVVVAADRGHYRAIN